MSKFIAAAIQMDSNDNKEQNLRNAVRFIEEAAARGAKLIVFPEQMNYAGTNHAENAENIPDGYTFEVMSKQAQKHGVWLHCGSIFEKNSDDPRPYNTSVIIGPDGNFIGKYRKLHLFDVEIKNGPAVKESAEYSRGDKIVTVATQEVGHLALSICYDIRFPELYRIMALSGAQILCAPADFTMNTGKDHWEVLLRARAIENTCYVIAPDQCGIKPQFQAYGKSMIIDPWGNVIAKAPDKACVITAEIDLDYLDGIRSQVPSLKNRRADIYRLSKIE